MIRRSPRPTTGWTTFSNELLTDDRLSFRSLGVLVYILSKPDDWTVRAEQLAKTHTEGRDAVRTALDELESAGYLVRRTWRSEDGTYASEQVVYDSSQNPRDNPPARETSAGYPTRLNRRGEPGPLTRTEDQGLRTRSTTRGVGRPAQRHDVDRPGTTVRRRVRVQPDEVPDSDEGPALGGSNRPSRAERDAVAKTRGVSGYGLALRLQEGLEAKGLAGAASRVNLNAVARFLNESHERGQSRDVQRAMVEAFVAAPERYMRGEDAKAWVAFIKAEAKLEAAAEKRRRAAAGGALYSANPYEGVE